MLRSDPAGSFRPHTLYSLILIKELPGGVKNHLGLGLLVAISASPTRLRFLSTFSRSLIKGNGVRLPRCQVRFMECCY